MHQTSTILGYFDRPSGERFTPLRGFSNAHLQTLLLRMVLFHGLENSFRSPYTHGLMQACQAHKLVGGDHSFPRLQRRA